MPVLVGGKSPKKPKGKGKWLAIGLVVPAFALLTFLTFQENEADINATAPATPSPVAVGIGVRRTAVTDIFGKPSIGFSFRRGEDMNGQCLVTGRSLDGLTLIELIGPPEDLTTVTIISNIPYDDGEAATRSILYAFGVLNAVVPEWSDGNEWFLASLETLANNGQDSMSTTIGNKTIELTLIRERGQYSLSVRH